MTGQNDRVQNTGWLYLVILLLFIGSMIFSTFFSSEGEGSLFSDALFSDGMLFLPCVIFLAVTKSSWVEAFRFRRIRISTFLLSLLYVVCWYPLTAAMNAVTMIFTENAAEQIIGMYSGMPFLPLWIVIAVMAPACEEFIFRGVILSGLRSGGRILGAVVLQGVMFGFLHLNLNQMLYAAVLGIGFGLLVESTGSIWTSYLGHMAINTLGVSAMVLQEKVTELFPGFMEGNMAESEIYSTGTYLSAFVVLMMVSCVTIPLSVLLLRAISCMEGREEDFRNIFRIGKQRETGEKVMTFPVILALLLGGAFILIHTLV